MQRFSPEHFFTRRQGYATTFWYLKNHKVYDVVVGRSEASLERYLQRLQAKAAFGFRNFENCRQRVRVL